MTTQRYLNPYLAGVLLGLVLLAAVVVSGRGLGASGAVKSAVIAAVETAAPAHAARQPFYAEYATEHAGNPLKQWLVFEVIGVLIGGFLSGLVSGRLTWTTEKGPRITSRTRLAFALAGGALFGIGAQFARGCTSGAALSGMAVLATAGFVTMLAIFGTAYAAAFFFRRLWI
ncbi:MAG TPA: YeeE/YedE thiosulfate transporter family protein [Vicinamibacteria bacterium]|nr:YeeE/YedE thiosulfate transporter family protein [Vicinamibacteria bacterium]